MSAASLSRLVDRYAEWVGDRYAAIATPDESSFASADGWRLAIRRYGVGLPVVLCHGFGGNHASFELDQGRGLAPWLASRGFAVHVVALRGTRGSEATFAADQRIRLEHWANRDLPALLDSICQQTGSLRVAWVGHSLGGLLPVLAGEQRISRLVALGPPWDLPKTAAVDSLRAARWLSDVFTRGRALPMKRLARLEAPLMGRFAWPPALSFVSPPNLEGDVARVLHAHATEDLPGGVIQDLDAWCRGALGWEARISAALRAWDVATTCIVGDDDRWAPPEVIAARVESCLPHAEIIRVGQSCGHRGGYGHLELLAGQHAQAETFELVARALAEPPR